MRAYEPTFTRRDVRSVQKEQPTMFISLYHIELS